MGFWQSEGFIVSQPTTLLMYFFPYGKKGCAIDSVGSHPRFFERMNTAACLIVFAFLRA